MKNSFTEGVYGLQGVGGGVCFGVLGLVIHINRANKNFIFSNKCPTKLTYDYAGPLNSRFVVLRIIL